MQTNFKEGKEFPLKVADFSTKKLLNELRPRNCPLIDGVHCTTSDHSKTFWQMSRFVPKRSAPCDSKAPMPPQVCNDIDISLVSVHAKAIKGPRVTDHDAEITSA